MFSRFTRRALIAAASAAALSVPVLVSAAAPATAAPGGNVVFRDHFTLKDSHIEQEEHGDEFCPDVPFIVRWDGIVTLTDMAKTRGGGDLEYFSFHISQKSTYTNVETGASFHEQVSFTTRDQKLAWNDDGTLSVTIMDRLGWKLFDGDGKLVGVDAGLVKIEIVVDIGDPADPEDDTEVGDPIITEHGTRALGERDFCQDIMTFIS